VWWMCAFAPPAEGLAGTPDRSRSPGEESCQDLANGPNHRLGIVQTCPWFWLFV
jgi:hypothetical protein